MADSPSLIGQTVSHYRIVEKLGGGGMGIAVGYFLPTEDAVMAALRRTPNPPPHSMASMTHDH